MRRTFVICGIIALIATSLYAQPASWNPDDIGPGGPENCLGARTCVKLSSTQVQITFGSSAYTGAAGQTSCYRLMSETDPAYQNGKFASSVSYTTTPDVSYPTGWAGKNNYSRFIVTVTFPTAMQTGQSYFVQVLGYGSVNCQGGTPMTGGRAALWVVNSSADTTAKAATNCLGIRHFELITNKILKITTGDGVDVTKIDNMAANFRLTCPTDPNYASGRAAVSVGRRTMGDCFLTTGWPYGWFLKHEIYLTFDQPFVQGQTYSINLNAVAAVTCGQATASILVNDSANINPAIKVNQLGYVPNAPVKYAYVGDWMGSAGVLTIDTLMTSFKVCDANTNAVVMTGTPSLRRRHEWYLVNGARQGPSSAGEGTGHEDYSYEDVWQIDISALNTPGQYYVTVPGMGRSFTFAVNSNVYANAFDAAMIGVTHQRCGLPMNAPWSPFYRPTCHRNFTTVGTTKNVDIQGGHHDAGDFDPRSHLDVAEQLLNAYYMSPKTYFDGQNRLPENANGIPDILDEARWELDLWTRMQDATGAVHPLIETPGGAAGDVDMVTPGELDTIADVESAVTPAASFRAAGNWALAADFYAALGDTTTASSYTTKAINAYTYGTSHSGLTSSNRDSVCYGAVLLYRRTGTTSYKTDFENWSVFGTAHPVSGADLDTGSNDQELASFYYASLPYTSSRAVDSTLKGKILTAYNNRMTSWINNANTYGYRVFRHPYAPNNWGTGCYCNYLASAIHAYMLTGNRTYLQWIYISGDYTLGCDPMNTVFINRLGQRCISGPLHTNSRYTPSGPIPGIQCEGPSPETGGSAPSSNMDSWVPAAMYPAGPWPQLHTYTDWVMSPSMNEGVVTSQAKTANVFGFLLHVPASYLDGGLMKGCYVFYNNSAFDGNNAAANSTDDAAIATDKSPLQSGGTATFANYTSYSRGINGIMVDISGAPGTPTLDDFAFKVGNDNNPGAWQAAPTPSAFLVRAGAGVSGSTRITITWADNAIQKQWLQITVRSSIRTGLAGGDKVYYFGNAIGETGNSASSARVDSADYLAVASDPHKTFANPAPITNVYDFNRDKKVETSDQILSRNNITTALTELKLIIAP